MPTYPSVVFYSVVDRDVIPEDTLPVEMLVGNPDELDESEITAYIMSIDDRTLCAEDEHTVLAIGPSFRDWSTADSAEYKMMKEREAERLTNVLERRFPGFTEALRYTEVATPRTIERYCLKNGGAVAGPKQMLGQHMFKRLHTATEWDNLFCCGESTVMGTGTPTVTTEGLTAANAVLNKRGMETFTYTPDRKNYVRMVAKPYTEDRLYADKPAKERELLLETMRCRLCENPTCVRRDKLDVAGLMRRVAVGNLCGARRMLAAAGVDDEQLARYEKRCVWALEGENPIPIREVAAYVKETNS